MVGQGQEVMVTRRNILQGAGLTAALAAAPALARGQQQGVVVYDSRLPESAIFAAQNSGVISHDIASGHAGLRGGVPSGARVQGLTRWSDYVSLRLALRGAGLRPAAQTPASAPISGHHGLIRWTLEPRA